jgi:mannose/fructose/N-acetylgalactosamine-specific phosphotransferase system component IIC
MTVMISAGIEFVKLYLPDNIEPKVLPIASIVLGAIIGFVSGDILTGIVSGITASGIYKFTTKVADKLGGNGNSTP